MRDFSGAQPRIYKNILRDQYFLVSCFSFSRQKKHCSGYYAGQSCEGEQL